MTHRAEYITTQKISRRQREKAVSVSNVIHAITRDVSPVEGPHLTGFDSHGNFDELHRAYFSAVLPVSPPSQIQEPALILGAES